MTTHILSASGAATLSLSNYHDSVEIKLERNLGLNWASGVFDRAAFLALVEEEMNVRLVPADAIVIERSELPEVEHLGNEVRADGHYGTITKRYSTYEPGEARRAGLRLLALSEDLTEHSPIDPAQVEELATAIYNAGVTAVNDGADEFRSLAAALIAAGWKK